MNKSDLIGLVSEKIDMSKKDVEKVVNAALDAIVETVAAGERVQLVGFGTFERRYRAERPGRNPQTKEKITIPALHVPVFKAGRSFKNSVK